MGIEVLVAVVAAAMAAYAAVISRSRSTQLLLCCFLLRLQMGRQHTGWWVTPRPQQQWQSFVRPDAWDGSNDADYYKLFRMGKPSFNKLMMILRQDLLKMDTNYRKCLEPRRKLAAALHKLAEDSLSYHGMAILFGTGQSTGHTILKDVCMAIVRRLGGNIHLPN